MKCTPGTRRNKQSATTLTNPKTKAGIFLEPLKSLSEIRPEAIVPTIPHTELIEIIKLASSVE